MSINQLNQNNKSQDHLGQMGFMQMKEKNPNPMNTRLLNPLMMSGSENMDVHAPYFQS